MNIHHVLSVSRWLLSMGSLILAFGLQQPASGADVSKFRRIEPQFIAALGDPAATSGNGAQSWGIWSQDPGPRACRLDHYPQLKATFPLPAGQYLVTGDRDVRTVLTVHPKDKDDNQRWELADRATLYDVTHLGCRSAPGAGEGHQRVLACELSHQGFSCESRDAGLRYRGAAGHSLVARQRPTARHANSRVAEASPKRRRGNERHHDWQTAIQGDLG